MLNAFVMIAHILFVISVFLVDLSHSVESTAAFTSANKVTSDGSSSPFSSNRQKRTVSDDNFIDDLSEEQQALEVLKRAPGWGKRFFDSYPETDSLDSNLDLIDNGDNEETHDAINKRAPGWGKRAPGWGKRGWHSSKRAPGWGKRAPGWGKRAPGWGKRAPGWGKRAPGWGKRSDDHCSKYDDLIKDYEWKLQFIKALQSKKCEADWDSYLKQN